ncbi:hypothetical protein [Oceaniglobus indicus]|uniref:hypothetical protein n=1 Tax=Oceaniglobus indicus TaxID=2047749 RepID=UPI000C1A22E6|nr:hypothetical protein [Oceaniglobus indicus]
MRVLIVAENRDLAAIWGASLERMGAVVKIESTQALAIRALQGSVFEIVILSLTLSEGSSLAVADFASYRHPDCRIIPVTSSSFFSDGSVFQHIPNACTTLGLSTPPEDVAAIVEHYGATQPPVPVPSDESGSAR